MKQNGNFLLQGPRGRRLCLEIAKELDPDLYGFAWLLTNDLEPATGASHVLVPSSFDDSHGSSFKSVPEDPSTQQLADAIASLDLTNIDDFLVQSSLELSVSSAMYWQPPDGDDVLARLAAIQVALVPIAEHIIVSSGTRWWSEPRQKRQWGIESRSADDPAPLPRNPQQTLRQWGETERSEEQLAARQRPRDPHANWSGTWWSIPRGLIQTVGQMPAGLDLIEDSFGYDQAVAIPVRGIGKTLEICTAEDWISLCRSFPLEVTASRRHDWFNTTGRDGRWVIPDWEQVATQWDAVHLTVMGYLNAATRTLQIDTDTASVIAGWDPDSTIWLTDLAREWEGPRQVWNRTNDTWILAP